MEINGKQQKIIEDYKRLWKVLWKFIEITRNV